MFNYILPVKVVSQSTILYILETISSYDALTLKSLDYNIYDYLNFKS